MTRRSRLVAAIFAVLQLMVAGLGPIADARLEASERHSVAHVESERPQPCSAGHDHLFCQICRVIGVTGGTTFVPHIIRTPAVTRSVLLDLGTNPAFRAATPSHA